MLGAWVENIPYGHSSLVGLENAAKAYFDKSPSALDAIDGLILAERVTISSGRYDANRFRKFAEWATRRGFIGDAEQVEALRRYEAAAMRFPAPV